MPATNRVAITSQDARVEADKLDTPEHIAEQVNAALQLVRDDLTRLSGDGSVKTVLTSGCFRLVSTATGRMDVWAISDTATAGSTGAAYHTLSIKVNGLTPLAQTYDTRRQEIPAYRSGVFLGQITVGYGDVVSVTIVVTGAPAPTLTTANFCVLATLKEN